MRLAFPQRTVYAVSPSKFHSYRSTDTNSGTLTSVNVSVPAVKADPSRALVRSLTLTSYCLRSRL